MPVRVSCPHCRMPCLVAEQHLGVPVKCGRCGRTFTTRGDPKATMRLEAAAPPARLDIGAATAPKRGRERKEDRFLVQHLIRCNLEERHELAVLVVADGSRVIPAAAAALAPLFGNFLNGASNDVVSAAETLAAACKTVDSTVALAVIWNGQGAIGGVGDCPIYHQSGGRMTRPKRGPLKLAAGDWLVLACDFPLDEAALQTEIAAARSSASELAQLLVERSGRDNGTVVVVRGY
ncbi:MAG: hypothetical protein ACRELG_24675 [Gemmataceae bacterium]